MHQLPYQKYRGTAASRVMGRRREGNYSSQKKKKSIQDSVENEENGYQVPDLKQTMINVNKNSAIPTKKKPQRRNLGRNL
jgi:hypothetical protein